MSEKSRDRHGRWRSRTVAFRASDEEIKEIDEAVALSGLTKQEYIITRLQNRDVVVVGNPRVFQALKKKLNAIYEELLRLRSAGEASEQFLETVHFVANILSEMVNNKGGN